MVRTLITGIGGAIGVHLMSHIMENTTWEVVGIDSFNHNGHFDRLTRACADHPAWKKRLTVLQHDLTTPFTPREIGRIGDIDYILNLASLSDVSASVKDPVLTIRNNTEITLQALELARSLWGLTETNHTPPTGTVFLQFSTDEIYGPAPRNAGHKEWDTVLPSNPYSASKACQEAMCIAYWRTYGLPLIITNTMNNFGPMQAPSKFPAMVQKNVALGNQTKIHAGSDGSIGTRYYLHSRNTSDAVLFILANIAPYAHKPGFVDRPDRYNIVGDRQLDNLELAKLIAELMGRPLRHELVDFHKDQPGHDLHYGLDGTKLRELGWRSPQSFEDSLKETIDWQRENHDWIEL